MLKRLLILMLIFAPVATFAQEKFAYVDAQKLFGQMPEVSEVETKIATKRESIQKNEAAIEAEYTALMRKWQELPEDASTTVRADIQRQIEQLQARFQTFRENSNEELQKESQDLITPIREKLMRAIKEVGDENGYTYIFDAQAMHYVNPKAIDATQQVKTKLGIKG